MKIHKTHQVILLMVFLTFQANAQEKGFDESVLSENGRQAYRTLLKTELFAIGPIYASAEVSVGERALDVLVGEKEAVPALRALVEKAMPEGGLYALLGLQKLEPDSFDKYLETFRKKPELAERGDDFDKIPGGEVKRMDGCSGFTEKRTAVADAIKGGEFDFWFYEEWVKIKQQQ
ncbi:MAG: hypothetical protein R2747_14620 [Pyrinomonadaceae bacterium]